MVFRGNAARDEHGYGAVFSEQGSSASHMAAADYLDTIGHMPGMELLASSEVRYFLTIPPATLLKIMHADADIIEPFLLDVGHACPTQQH